MKKSSYALTKDEHVVKDVIDHALELYQGLYSIEDGEAAHDGWEVEIVPKNPQAAKLYISTIGSNTIYLVVDGIYRIEFFVNEKEYKKDSQALKLIFWRLFREE